MLYKGSIRVPIVGSIWVPEGIHKGSSKGSTRAHIWDLEYKGVYRV